jgi:flagellar motor switch/type III secretory pathway protein FliN
MVTLYKPLALSQCEVEVLNELIFSKRVFSLSENDPDQKLRFVLPPTINNESFDFVLSLKTNHHHIDVSFHATSESKLMKCFLEFGGAEAIPKEFLTGVTAYCSQKIIALLEKFFEVPLLLESFKKNEIKELEDKQTLYFEIIRNDSTVELMGEIKLPLFLLKKILSLVAPLPYEVRSDLDQFPFEGDIIIGTVKLSQAQLSKLKPGDLIFFEEPSACVTGKIFLYFQDEQYLPLSLDPKELQPLIHNFKDVALSEFLPSESSDLEKQESEAKQELASLEKLVTIELAFSLGKLSLTIEQIAQLAKIKTYSPIENVSSSMKIYAQGTLIGVGELVEIHGQHAAFLTQLNLVK